MTLNSTVRACAGAHAPLCSTTYKAPPLTALFYFCDGARIKHHTHTKTALAKAHTARPHGATCLPHCISNYLTHACALAFAVAMQDDADAVAGKTTSFIPAGVRTRV